ncbi:sigma 54-interacting transcriptional regulator [Archangium minus]|uniref:sigma 54-interacting transcriptional regulator n=1 Tax=Archangium minus TaxID=83450 RepID=UPI0037BF675D
MRELASEWERRARDGDDRCRISMLPGGIVGVEIPVDEAGLRQWLLRYKQKESALDRFITEDIQLLCQLQIAMDHARSQESVLITGETGTGKGALAEAIHAMSGRKTLCPINCTAIAASLIESELFGHLKGSFTGASRDREGLIAAAENGTLFLDEVGDLAPEVQPKLLRVLREREYRRVGETEVRRTHARFIAATNANLLESVTQGLFRADLLQRLSACHIELPPLRDRPDDICLIAERVLKDEGHSGLTTEPVRTLMTRYDWPGNVAELVDAMRYAAVASRGAPIRISHLPDAVVQEAYPPTGTASQILLTAQVLNNSDIPKDHDTFPESLDAVLGEHLKSPPPIANNEEVDELVGAFVQLAFMLPGSAVLLTQAALDGALAQLRTVSLLSELRQHLSTSHFSSDIISTLDARLRVELEDVKGPPLVGMGIQVLMQLLGSDDPDDRSKLLEWALKFKKVVPMIVHLVQAIRQNTETPKPVAVNAMAVQPPRPVSFAQLQGTRDWLDPRNRPVVERAVRAAKGVKRTAGALLKINSSSYIARVIRAHGLQDLCDELTRARRAESGARTRSGGAPRKEKQVSVDVKPNDVAKGEKQDAAEEK